MDFKTKLIEERKAKGLTQEELALKCNVTVRTIQRIESGQVEPRTHTIKAISEILGFEYFKTTEQLNSHSIFWHLKDLFNLKTQKMKKISILGLLVMATLLFAFQFVSELSSFPKEVKHGLSIKLNKDGSTKRIDAVFSNILTFDSLVKIKSSLTKYGITLTYEGMRFDAKGGLTTIECEVNCNDGISGGFSADSLSKEKWTGFYRDYSNKAKAGFCAGPCAGRK